MNAALERLQTWFDGKELPPAMQSFAWAQKVPLRYWQNALILFLTIVLALNLARLFWLIFAPTQAVDVPPAYMPHSPSSPAIQNANVDIAALKALDLFGKKTGQDAPAQEVEQQPVVIDAVETKLDLVLKGIVGSNRDDSARAIIARGDEQDIYAPGDKLPVGNRVSLDRVLNDRVILNSSGRYESLLLYEEGESFQSEAIQTVAGQPQKRIAVPEPARQALASGRIPESINDIIRLTVARKGSEIIGYRVRPGRYRDFFDQLGFKTGDVVTHVNGVNVDDPGKAMSVYKEVRAVDAARFDILRDGESLSLEIDLAELNIDGAEG